MHTPLFQDSGHAETLVVFVHGLIGSPGQFGSLIEAALGKGCAIAAPLLPGHGGPWKGFARCGVEEWETHLQNELDQYIGKYENVLIVGHSMGGLLGLNASLARKNNIQGVFLLASPMKANCKPWALWAKMKLLVYPMTHPIKKTYWEAKSIPKIAVSLRWFKPLGGLYRLMRKTRRNLPHVFVPVTIVHSQRDEMVAFKSADILCNGLKNTTRQRITLCDSWHVHYTQEEQAAVCAALLGFLEETLSVGKNECDHSGINRFT